MHVLIYILRLASAIYSHRVERYLKMEVLGAASCWHITRERRFGQQPPILSCLLWRGSLRVVHIRNALNRYMHTISCGSIVDRRLHDIAWRQARSWAAMVSIVKICGKIRVVYMKVDCKLLLGIINGYCLQAAGSALAVQGRLISRIVVCKMGSFLVKKRIKSELTAKINARAGKRSKRYNPNNAGYLPSRHRQFIVFRHDELARLSPLLGRQSMRRIGALRSVVRHFRLSRL